MIHVECRLKLTLKTDLIFTLPMAKFIVIYYSFLLEQNEQYIYILYIQNKTYKIMKELYYIRGNKKNPQSVKQALLNKGGIDDFYLEFDSEDLLYYIDKDSKITFTRDGTQSGEIIMVFGTELEPVEILKPFDRVIAKCRNGLWTTNFYSYRTQYGMFKCGNDVYDECHHYEPWMDEFVGTDTPWDEFHKE